MHWRRCIGCSGECLFHSFSFEYPCFLFIIFLALAVEAPVAQSLHQSPDVSILFDVIFRSVLRHRMLVTKLLLFPLCSLSSFKMVVVAVLFFFFIALFVCVRAYVRACVWVCLFPCMSQVDVEIVDCGKVEGRLHTYHACFAVIPREGCKGTLWSQAMEADEVVEEDTTLHEIANPVSSALWCPCFLCK